MFTQYVPSNMSALEEFSLKGFITGERAVEILAKASAYDKIQEIDLSDYFCFNEHLDEFYEIVHQLRKEGLDDLLGKVEELRDSIFRNCEQNRKSLVNLELDMMDIVL